MKMHFCIPVSQQRSDAMGGLYVVGLGPGADWVGRGSVTLRTPLTPTPTPTPASPSLPWITPGVCLCFQLYSVYLDGFLFCKVRYSQLHRWNEQVSLVGKVCPRTWVVSLRKTSDCVCSGGGWPV